MKRSERAVSRVLSPRFPGAVIIYLGPALLRATSGLPGSLGRAVLIPLREALPYAALLQAGFAKHSRSPGSLVGSYPTVSPLPLRAVFFSVALSMGSPPVPFRDRLALWSPDFPPPFRGAITSPALTVKDQERKKVGRYAGKIKCIFFPSYRPSLLSFAHFYYFSFSSIALFARASASLFRSLGIYCTSTEPIRAMSSRTLAWSGLSPSFFTRY